MTPIPRNHPADALPPVREALLELSGSSEEEASTGLFEDWDEGALQGEALSPADAAAFHVVEPRPVSDAVVDWPPPMRRPGGDYLPDWIADGVGTLIVIDPQKSWSRSPHLVLAVDLGAWLLGFMAMFFTGLVTTASAALVLFALSL